MALAYASSAVGNTSGDGDVTVTKPSGLVEGDMMVALCWRNEAGAGSAGDFDTPSGWTKLGTAEANDNDVRISSFAKVADSGDEAASNFTFSPADTDGDKSVVVMVRVTGSSFSGGVSSLVADSHAAGDSTGGANNVSWAGVTPITSTSLLIMAAGTENDTDVLASGYGVVNNNPTWTEDQDAVYDPAGIGINYAVAYGAYASGSATGNADYDVTSNGNYVGVLIAISESVDVTVSGTTGLIDFTGNDGSVAAGANTTGTTGLIDLTGNDGTVTTPDPKWVNKDKSSAPNIVNKDKS